MAQVPVCREYQLNVAHPGGFRQICTFCGHDKSEHTDEAIYDVKGGQVAPPAWINALKKPGTDDELGESCGLSTRKLPMAEIEHESTFPPAVTSDAVEIPAAGRPLESEVLRQGDATSCPVCYDEFSSNSSEKQPRRLNCTHIICTACLGDQFEDGEVLCSECFEPTKCDSIASLPALEVTEGPVPGYDSRDDGSLQMLPADTTSCPVCYVEFSNDPSEKQARQLACTHIICTACLGDQFEDGEVLCPECFQSSCCSAIADLPVLHPRQRQGEAVLAVAPLSWPKEKSAGALSAFMSSTVSVVTTSVPTSTIDPVKNATHCIRDGCDRPRGPTGYCAQHASRRLSAASTNGLLKSFSSTFSRSSSMASQENNASSSSSQSVSVALPLHPFEMAKLFERQDIVEFDVAWEVIEQVKTAFSREPNRLQLEAPLTVVGDIHGQYFDLMRMFKLNGDPPMQSYLFLGDYVDRGKFSCEVMLYLFSLKLAFPENVHLIRGNHECASVSGHFGFKDECRAKYGNEYGSSIYNRFVLCFQCMPLCATIGTSGGCVFAVHGGISPELERLEEIDQLDRFVEPPVSGPLCDMLWSDPWNETAGKKNDGDTRWAKNDVRGCSFYYSEEAADDFLKANNIVSIIRAHEVQELGYQNHFPGSDQGKGEPAGFDMDDTDPTLTPMTLSPVVTVFSAPNYCGRYG